MQPGRRTVLSNTSRRDFLIGGSSLAALLFASGVRYPLFAEEKMADLARALTNAFAAMGGQLYSALSSKPGNIVFSPYSIGTAMAMAMSGARGQTEQEIANVLQLRLTRGETEEASGKVVAILKSYDKSSDPRFCPQDARWTGMECEAPPSPDRKCRPPSRLENDRCVSGPALPDARLLVANALMLAEYGDLVSADYRALVRDRYAAEVFSGATLEQVNGWVKEKTSGKIAKILDTLGREPVMVLLNAVYFKAAWATPFSRSATQDSVFHLSSAKAIETPTMHREAHFAVLARPGFRAIELPYSERALSMVVVLPDSVDGLPQVAKSLGGDEAAKFLFDFKSRPSKKVVLALPRFKSSSALDLIPPFKRLGLNVALSDNADFAGITGRPAGQEGIKIDQIRHRALVEVMEEGTEAAAATAITAVRAHSMRPADSAPEPFVVDRPFLYFIADAASGAVLFQGSVADPSLQA
jgi:serpin B